MNERELGRALMAGQHPIDIAKLTQRVLRRDRRRIWILGTFCVIAWMLVVMLPWATILPMMAKISQHVSQVDQTEAMQATTNPMIQKAISARMSARDLEFLAVVKQGTVATFMGSIASMFMAAVCTVSLIVLSRRATLRQVNARLGEISDQLRLLSNSNSPRV